MAMIEKYILAKYYSLFLISVMLFINACSSVVQIERDSGPRPGSVAISKIPNAVPKYEPKSQYGNPTSYIVNGKRYYVLASGDKYVEQGIASWYGEKFHGRRTSNGETYDMYAMTAAHKTLPLPAYVKITNLNNGKSVTVRVNDRGPFHENRIIDLSYTAAAKLDILSNGTGLVEVRSIGANNIAGRRVPINDPLIIVNASLGYDNSEFYIQIGAYTERTNAVNMREKLDPIGDNLLKINETMINGNTIYRVRFGPLSDIALADRIVENLKFYGVFEHYITLD